MAPQRATRNLALLRGVNVGGRNRLPMADLRRLFESHGYTQVATLIQSGNVVFTGRPPVLPEQLAASILDRFGIETTVVVRDLAALNRVVRDNPLAGTELAKLHVGFMAATPAAEVVSGLDAAPFSPETFAVLGEEVYLYLPDGMARTKLPSYLDRQLGVPITIRNWNTVVKLLELMSR